MKFEAFIEPWIPAYQCAVITYVGLKVEQHTALLFGRVLLEASKTGINETPLNFESEHVIAARFVASAKPPDIARLLMKARNGETPRGSDDHSLALERERDLSTFFAPIYHPLIAEGPRLPSLLIRGSSRHDLLARTMDPRQLDWELKAADAPFDNFDELLSNFGLPTVMQMGDSATLEIVSRAPGMIAPSSMLKEGDAIIECRVAEALDVGKIKIGYKIFRNDSIDRKNIKGATLEWRSENDVKIGSCRVPIGTAPVVQAFLSYAGTSLHQCGLLTHRSV